MKSVFVTGVICATILGILAILSDVSLTVTVSAAGTFVVAVGATKLLS
jgi:hypothetical protein